MFQILCCLSESGPECSRGAVKRSLTSMTTSMSASGNPASEPKSETARAPSHAFRAENHGAVTPAGITGTLYGSLSCRSRLAARDSSVCRGPGPSSFPSRDGVRGKRHASDCSLALARLADWDKRRPASLETDVRNKGPVEPLEHFRTICVQEGCLEQAPLVTLDGRSCSFRERCHRRRMGTELGGRQRYAKGRESGQGTARQGHRKSSIRPGADRGGFAHLLPRTDT